MAFSLRMQMTGWTSRCPAGVFFCEYRAQRGRSATREVENGHCFCRQFGAAWVRSEFMNQEWKEQFRQVYARGSAAWKQGRRTAATMFRAEDATFLAGIGCTTQELFDFVDDQQRYGEPDLETAVAV